MANSRDDVIRIIASRVLSDYRKNTAWSDVVSAVQGFMTAQDRQEITDAAQKSDAAKIGKVLLRAINAYQQDRATTEADQMMADDTLTLTDLLRIL